MKKIFVTITVLVFTLLVVACQRGPVLNLYLPNEYIHNEYLFAKFKEETGIRVSEANFDDNEQALASIGRGASYDLVIPSDYAIEELAQKNLIAKLDWTKITTLNKDNDFVNKFVEVINVLKTQGFDFLEYAAPYFWGNLGLVYDTRIAGLEDSIIEKGWNALINENDDSTIRVVYDSSRDALFVALKAQGLSLASATVSQITTEGKAFLNRTKHANTRVLSDQILYDMIDTNDTKYHLSIAYSGDAVYLMDENEYLNFIVPNQGTNVFLDGFVIPTNAKNVDAAYQFINFMLKHENAYENSVGVGYTSPIQSVYDEVLANDYTEIGAYVVSFNAAIDEFFRYDDTKKKAINDVWNIYRAS